MNELVRVSRDGANRVYRLKDGYVRITPTEVTEGSTIRQLTTTGSWRVPTEAEKAPSPGRVQRIPADSLELLRELAHTASYLEDADRVRIQSLAYMGKATVSDAKWMSGTFNDIAAKTELARNSAPIQWSQKVAKTIVASAFDGFDTFWFTGQEEPYVDGIVAVDSDDMVHEYIDGEFQPLGQSVDEFDVPFLIPADEDELDDVITFLAENPGQPYDSGVVDDVEATLAELAEAGIDVGFLDMLQSIFEEKTGLTADAAGYSPLERSRNSRRQRRRPDGTFGPGRYATMPSVNNNKLNRRMRMSNWHRARLKKILPEILAPGQSITEWIKENPMLWNARTLRPIRASGATELRPYEADDTVSTIIALIPAEDDPINSIGPEEKHITVAFLGDSEEGFAAANEAAQAISEAAVDKVVIPTRGLEEFDGGAKVVLVDRPSVLPARETALSFPKVFDLDRENNSYPEFTSPHVTIGYSEGSLDDFVSPSDIPSDITFDRVAVWRGPERVEYPLGTPEPEEITEDAEQAPEPAPQPVDEDGTIIVAAGTLADDAPAVEEPAPTDDGEPVSEDAVDAQTSNDMGKALYYAVVDNVDKEAIYDVVAILPDENGNAAAWVRRGSQWVVAEDFIREFNSSQPPTVVQLEDENIIKDVLAQIDKYDTENPDQLDALSVETEQELVASIRAYRDGAQPEERNWLRVRAYALNRPDAIPTEWWDSAVSDLSVLDNQSPLYGEDGQIYAVTAAGIPGVADTPSDLAAVERLKRYWTVGAGAAKIRWGTDGDLTRCHRHLSKYMPSRSWNYCQVLHQRVFGMSNYKRDNR